MKILVLSDIHGRTSYAENIMEREQPDEVIFLGDGLSDVRQIEPFYPRVRFHTVQGNCDFGAEKTVHVLTLASKTIFCTHGHRFQVKLEREMNYITLRSAAAAYEADIILFGHTHLPDIVYMDGAVLMNPGAAANGKYGVITLEDDNILPELKSL